MAATDDKIINDFNKGGEVGYSTCQQILKENDIDFLIDTYGLYDNSKIYQKVFNFEDLLKTGVAFLDGRITDSFDYPGPLDDETLVLVEDLKILHEKGILTLSSQPQKSTNNYVIEIGHDKGKKADIHQKEYVKCIVKNEEVYKIKKCLEGNKNILYSFVNLEDGSIITNWDKKSFILYRDRTHHKKSPSSEWENVNSVSQYTADHYISRFRKLPIYKSIKHQCTGLLVHSRHFSVSDQPIKYLKNLL